MSRFVFRLASILKLREFEFESAKKNWLVIENERRTRQTHLDQMNAQLAIGQKMLSEDVARGTEARRLILHARGLAVGRFQQAQAEVRLAELDGPIVLARQKMMDARVRVRSLEKMRDRQREEHRLEAGRQEQIQLDEMSTLRAARAIRETRICAG